MKVNLFRYELNLLQNLSFLKFIGIRASCFYIQQTKRNGGGGGGG